MSAELISINAFQFKCIQSNAHQCGTLSRASRALIQCTNAQTANRIIEQTLNELNLTGFYKLAIGEQTYHRQFGDLVITYDDPSIAGQIESASKVCQVEGFLILKTEDILLVVKFDEDVAVEMIDMFKDNLVIFIDTVQTWVSQYQDTEDHKNEIFHEKLFSADKLNEILGYLKIYNAHLIESNRAIYKELLSSMAGQFPILGLEGDQEEAILDIIDSAHSKQEQILDAQVHYNDDLRNILSDLIGSLIGGIEEAFNGEGEELVSKSVELF